MKKRVLTLALAALLIEIVKRYVPAEVVEHVKEGIVLMD